MHAVITEDNPRYTDIDTKVLENKPRLNFRSIAKDIKDLIATRQGKGHIVIEYSHEQTSNVVYALKRHGLMKGADYMITKSFKKDTPDDIRVEQIIITPVYSTPYDLEQ